VGCWRGYLDADLHLAQLMPLPLTVSCCSKIQIGFTFLVPAHLGSPGQRAVKRVCVCVSAESKTVLQQLADADIASLTGLVKLYFRELPDGLLTSQIYRDIVKSRSSYHVCSLADPWGTGR